MLEIGPAVEMAFLVEVVMDGGVDGDEFLQTSHTTEAEHCPFSSSKRKVRILSAVIQPTPPKAIPPKSHSFMADFDPALMQKIFHIVRHQSFWFQRPRKLGEYLTHLVDSIMRRVCGVASAGVRVFCV